MKKTCIMCRYGVGAKPGEWLDCVNCFDYSLWELRELREPNQSAKADAGKPKLSLVPSQIIRDIAVIREYGNKKYGDPENWKTVEPSRYFDAYLRHSLAMVEKGMNSKDEESGLLHAAHAACNLAFILEMVDRG